MGDAVYHFGIAPAVVEQGILVVDSNLAVRFFNERLKDTAVRLTEAGPS